MRTKTERALRMAIYMEDIPDEQFDIRLWITRLNGVDTTTKEKVEGCGTVCCFVGHLPFCFPEEFHHDVLGACVVQGHRMVDYRAGAEFFGLTAEGFANVIYESKYPESQYGPTRSVVVGRFLDLVGREHGIEDMEGALRMMRRRMEAERAERGGRAERKSRPAEAPAR